MIGVWSYTVILTYLGLAASVFGITLSAMYAAGVEGISIIYPVMCILFAGLCDMFDGRVARTKKNRTEFEKQFGIQIDSLCDAVCFGVSPAVLGYCLGGNKILGIISAVCLVLAGVIRLGYFNVVEIERRSDPDNDDHDYYGVPITMSAFFMPLVCCFANIIGPFYFPYVYQITAIVLSFFFLAKIKIPKPGTKGIIVLVILGLLVFTGLLILN